VKTTRWQAIATPVLWLGVFGLLWALGAWLLFALMGGIADEVLLGAVVRVALVVALVAGTVVSRRSRIGYQILAAAGLACAVLYGGAFTVGSITGMVTLVAAGATLVAALVRLRTSTAPEGALEAGAGETAGSLEWSATESVQSVDTGSGAGAAPRSPVEAAVAWSLAIAGLLVLARALLELVKGLAELPGAGEHWAGDVVLWLVFVLPIPILAGVTLLAAARWLWGHRIGARGATAIWLVLVGIATTWILVDVAFVVGSGNYVRPLEDPLLWAPIAGLVGSIAGAVLLVVIEVRRRVARPSAAARRW
jgi:hypothetical protein